MVKRIKFIFTRIIIGVGICLILQYLQGSLIGNVYAEVYTISKNDGTNFSSCTNCSSLTYDWNYDIGLNSSGFLYFNAIAYGTYGGTSYLPSFSNARVKVNDIWYSCSISNSSQINDYNNVNYITNNASMHCPIKFKNSSIIQTIQINTVGQGVEGISLYSPISYVEDSSSSINNQIQESTQQTIDSQKTCKKYDKTNIKIDGKYLINNGTTVDDSNYGITNYIKINDSTTITPLTSFNSQNANYCFYDINKDLISCFYINSFSANIDLTIPTNASYFRSSISKAYNKPTYKVCNNGNQGVVDATDSLNDTLNDDNVSSGTNDSIGGLLTPGTQSETFGPVADLLLLPLTLFGAFYSGFDNTCTPFNLGSLYNTNIILPCINLRNILGASLYNTIDIAISLFMILNIVLMCIDIFDRITSLEDPFNELYSPKHVYQPRHGGGK